MSFNDIATNAAANLGWKAKGSAAILLISTFAWSLISVGVATTAGTWAPETLIIVTMLNAAEMVGASWILAPVLNAIVDNDVTRMKLKKIVQGVWGSTVWMAYLAEFCVVVLGTWERFANFPHSFLWWITKLILALAITIITVFGTDFSLNILMATTRRKSSSRRTLHQSVAQPALRAVSTMRSAPSHLSLGGGDN